MDPPLLAHLLFDSMTPKQFRDTLANEPQPHYYAMLFDEILRMRIQKRENPVNAERTAMVETRRAWSEELIKAYGEETFRKLMELRETPRKFVIDLSRNWPVGKGDGNPWIILAQGCPPWMLEGELKKVLPPDAADIVLSRIRELGGTGYTYVVRMRREGEGFSIAVQRQDSLKRVTSAPSIE